MFGNGLLLRFWIGSNKSIPIGFVVSDSSILTKSLLLYLFSFKTAFYTFQMIGKLLYNHNTFLWVIVNLLIYLFAICVYTSDLNYVCMINWKQKQNKNIQYYLQNSSLNQDNLERKKRTKKTMQNISYFRELFSIFLNTLITKINIQKRKCNQRGKY
jgi:hypothetical protein